MAAQDLIIGAARLERLRLVLLALMVSLPIVAVWPPDAFDPFFGVKAAVIIGLGLGVTCWWLLVALSRPRPVLRGTPLVFVWLALLCWMVLSTVLSVDPAGAVWGSPGREDGLLVWFANLAVFALACTAVQGRDWDKVWTVLVVAALVVSAFAVAQRFGFDPLSSGAAHARGRSSSTLRNPVLLGGYLALVVPIVVAWCARLRGGWRKLAGAVGVGVLVAALYFTFSRAAWLGALGGTIVLVAWIIWRARGRLRGLAVVLGVACAVAVALSLLPQPTAPGTEAHSLGQDASTILDPTDSRNSGRLATWEIAVQMIGDRPWFGVGLDQMGSVFEDYRTARYDAAEGAQTHADRAHSDPLHMAVTTGIPAALLFYVLVALALWRSRRKFVQVDQEMTLMWVATAAGGLGYLAQSLVSITVPGVHSLFFVLLGGLAARSDPLRATAALPAPSAEAPRS